MNKTMITMAALLALAAAPAVAREPSFVSPAQTQVLNILPAPPTNDSEITKAELAELHALESSRTEAQSRQAIWDDENEHIFLFASVLGEKFTAEALPAVAAFSKRVRNDEGLNAAPAKAGFNRIRPYNLDKTLKTKDDSYPSGHTTTGFLLGLALIDMVPEKRDVILARAEQYGHNRLVCGVHYASDIPASRLVAYTVHAIMKQHPAYQAEMVAARTELRAALGLPAELPAPPALPAWAKQAAADGAAAALATAAAPAQAEAAPAAK
jgi:acid phosphatase (class A)